MAVIIKAGLSLPEDEEAKTATQLVQEPEEELQEELQEPQEEEEPAEKPDGSGLSIDEVVGTYSVKRVDGNEESLMNITKIGNGQLSVDDDLIFDYDQNTSTATCSYENEAGRGTADLTFTFKDGKINIRIYWVYTNEQIDETYIMESKGIKTD